MQQYNAAYNGSTYGNQYVTSSIPLPPGWQAAVTADNQTYYIDHNTKTTHWALPADVMQSMNGGLPQYGATYGAQPVRFQGGNAGGARNGGYGNGHGTNNHNGSGSGSGSGSGNGNGNGYGRQRRGIDRTKLKTKMCMNIENGGTCSYGDNCAFAHRSEELSTHPHFNGNAAAAAANGQPQAAPAQQQQLAPHQDAVGAPGER